MRGVLQRKGNALGTRGAFGVRINEQDKLTYNHFDSYPSGLGVDIKKDITEILADPARGMKWLRKYAKDLVLVESDETPTPKQVERLREYANTSVSTGSLGEWYVLLRELQGKLAETLKVGYMIDRRAFVNDSLFCEYAYIVNLDTEKLEVYRGFQRKKHSKGRYSKFVPAKRGRDTDYFAVALVDEIPLMELVAMSDDDFSKRAYDACGRDEEAA